MKKVLSAFVLLLVCTVTYAGGYRVSLQGNRSLAMGHTGVAYVDSAELAFFNPGGLVYLENKLSISAGGFGVFADVKYQNAEFGSFAQTESNIGTPAYFYASYKLNDKFALGLAIYTPYGSRVEYPTDWAGSHLVNDIDLSAIYIQPLFSTQVTEHVSFGGGPILAIGSVGFNRNLNRTLADVDGNRSNVDLEASGVTGFGFSVGAYAQLSDKWSLGVNYRSRIDIDAEAGDGTYAEWNAYEALNIDFLNPDGSVALESLNPRNYKNAWIIRTGAEYRINDKIAVRGGAYFDESPVQDGFFAPETPRNDSFGFTGGFSFDVTSRLAIDASFLYLTFAEVDASFDFFLETDGTPAPFEGTYKSSVFSPGLGISYKL